MKQAIIYDNKGNIILSTTTIEEVDDITVGVIFTDDIDGKILKSVNPKTGEPIYEDKPKTEIEILREKIVTLQQGITELTDVVISE